MKKSKKKLRGMTLVEVIIAILIFALLGMVLLGVGNATDAHQRAARKTNKKVNEEGPIAEAQSEENAILLNRDYQIVVGEKKAAGATDSDEVKEKGYKVVNPVTIHGRLYSVEKGLVDESTGKLLTDDGTDKGNNIPDPNNDKGNFKFIEIDKPVETTTTVAGAPPVTTTTRAKYAGEGD